MEKSPDSGIKKAVLEIAWCFLGCVTVPIRLQLVDSTGVCKLIACHVCLRKLKLLEMPWRLPNYWKLLLEKHFKPSQTEWRTLLIVLSLLLAVLQSTTISFSSCFRVEIAPLPCHRFLCLWVSPPQPALPALRVYAVMVGPLPLSPAPTGALGRALPLPPGRGGPSSGGGRPEPGEGPGGRCLPPRRRLGAPRPRSLRQLPAVAGHGGKELPPRRPDPRRPAPGRRLGGCGADVELRGGAESFPATAARPARRRPGVPAGR